ncbi:ceramide synthase 6 [Pelomyxa schiedti]|nr:ceramide synthase 6 [Pelomyxa schiedti]
MGRQERIASAIALCAIPIALWYAMEARHFVADKRERIRGQDLGGGVGGGAYDTEEDLQSLSSVVRDFGVAAAFTVAIVVFRVLLSKFVLSSLTEAWVNHKEWDESELRQRREKFEHCFFLSLYYITATGFGWYALYDKSWVPAAIVPGASGEVNNCWTNFWFQFNERCTEVKLYYMLSLGYTFQSLFFLIVRKHRRNFFEMAIHHTLEMLLIIYSWGYGYVRIGTLVLALHDVGDVFINVLRCANELRFVKTSVFLLLSTLVTWVWFRLWAYPWYVIRSTMFYAYDIVMSTGGGVGESSLIAHEGYYFFNAMLCALYVLHWFWFYMFLKITYHALFMNRVDDEVDVVVTEKHEQEQTTPTTKKGQ